MLRINVPAIAIRGFHTTSVCNIVRVRAGRYKCSKKRTVPLTYEQAKPPYLIGVEKAWNSWNTSNLNEEERKGETLVEDTFIRQFMVGTWPGLFVSEIIIKRRHNTVVIAGLICPKITAPRLYFLVGFTEELLSSLLKCPVKVEFQTVHTEKDAVFKWI